MVKLDDAPWKNPPPRKLTDEEKEAIRVSSIQTITWIKLQDCARMMRELGCEQDAAVLDEMRERLDSDRDQEIKKVEDVT